MAHHAQDGGVGNDLLGVGDASIRVGHIIERGELDIKAHGLQGSGELGQRQRCAVLDVNSHNGLIPREW